MKIIDSARDAVKMAAHFIESIVYLGSEARTAHKLLDAVGIPRNDCDDDDPYILELSERIKIYAQRRADAVNRSLEDTICIPVDDYDQLCQAAEKYHATQNV